MPGTFFAIGSVNIVRPAPGTGNSVYSCTEIDGPHPAVERLRKLDLNSMTPIEALNLLNELKRECE